MIFYQMPSGWFFKKWHNSNEYDVEICPETKFSDSITSTDKER